MPLSPAETQRKARLANALRENLKRRKTQARARMDLASVPVADAETATLGMSTPVAPLLPEMPDSSKNQG